MLRADLVEAGEYLHLDIHVFAGGFHDKIATGHRVDIRCRLDSSQSLITVFLTDFLLAHQPSEAVLDSAQSFLDKLIRYILHDDVVAVNSTGLRNAVAHRARAYDANTL